MIILFREEYYGLSRYRFPAQTTGLCCEALCVSFSASARGGGGLWLLFFPHKRIRTRLWFMIIIFRTGGGTIAEPCCLQRINLKRFYCETRLPATLTYKTILQRQITVGAMHDAIVRNGKAQVIKFKYNFPFCHRPRKINGFQTAASSENASIDDSYAIRDGYAL